MGTLFQLLKSRHPEAKDVIIKSYILQGFVKKNKESITNPEFPVRDTTVFEFENEYLLDKPVEYWIMKELDERWLNVSPTTRALGIELKMAHVSYILEKKADIVLLNFKPYDVEGFVEMHVGNLFLDDFSSKLTGVFDVVICCLISNPLRVLGVVEKYLDKIHEHGMIAVMAHMNEHVPELKESYDAVASAIGLKLQASGTLEIDPQKLCLIFRR